MKYRITLVESEEGWAVWCDDLPGCCSQGATRAEALENIDIAAAEYLAARTDDAAFAAVLAKVPDVEPEPHDRW